MSARPRPAAHFSKKSRRPKPDSRQPRRYGTPRRRFAQHFLEPAWVAKLVDAIAPSPHQQFLEIGPGRGAITEPLAARAGHVVAVEIDRDLAARLVQSGIGNVTVIVANVLDVDIVELVTRELHATATNKVRVVGNLPYNISSPILFKLLAAASSHLLEDATLMLQKEVADRLLASPGTGEYGVVSVLTALWADVTPVLALPPGAFRPMPQVRSAVVRLSFRAPTVPILDHEIFVNLVRSMFTQRRKTLGNAVAPFATSLKLDAVAALTAASIDPRRRPETLQLIELARLADVFTSRKQG
jgi:16S rRNA (adenine1518-N6/adenine1519-N6)-dimethyltransferase